MSSTLQLLPQSLRDALASALSTTLLGATALSGGMINHAARVDTRDGAVFVKWNAQPLPGLFAAEAAGLRTLQATRTLRVPRVVAMDDSAERAFLALEYIEVAAPRDHAAFTRRFAEGLAALHRSTGSSYGFEQDNYIGSLPQSNASHRTWPQFYRECRLLPQLAIARRLSRLPAQRERLLMHVVENLESLLAGLDARPVLLHGDLWSGNFLTAGDEPAIIDPAVYYGEREVELAFVELFGGFPPGFVAAYDTAYPLDSGYTRRRPLHQLYPLLVHLNHFGEPYGADVDRIRSKIGSGALCD